jgi:diguanylate cyclase (GGDEF)-like protein/PAS domain S-box-containing protein
MPAANTTGLPLKPSEREFPMTNKALPHDSKQSWPEREEEGKVRLVNPADECRPQAPDLSERAHWLETVIDQIPDYIYAKDLDGRFLFANRITVIDNNLDHLDQLIGKTDFDLHPYAAAASIEATERKVMETGEPDLGIEEKSVGRRADRWLMMSRVPLRDLNGRIIGVVGVSRDITARKAAEHLMQTQARLLEMVAQGIALDLFMDELARMVEDRMEGVRVAVMVRSAEGQELELVAAPSLPHAFREAISHMPFGPFAPSCGIAAWRGQQVVCADIHAEPRWEGRRAAAADAGVRSCWSVPIKSFKGAALGTLALYFPSPIAPEAKHDELIAIAAHLARIAIERRQAEERISFLASHDGLTGLPNRVLMDQALAKAIREADKSGRHVALAYLDLDNFKLVNDSLGHAAGDELLKIVASRLSEVIGEDGMVVRIGGDEFIIFMEVAPADLQDLIGRFEALRDRLADPISLQGLQFQVSGTMGVACHPQHGRSAQELLANADAAMYRAKEAGRDQLRIFSAEMAEKTRAKLARTEELRRALRQDEFRLHYQPQRDQRTGRITGAEALVRWQHPMEGLLAPSDFIPLAEEAGLIVALGDWVLHEACRQARAWQAEGLPEILVSVNVSARQFREAEWAGEVARALADSGLSPENLELEITESLIMEDAGAAVERMRDLDALGVKLAIDDFGTGYSSLSALKRFPVSRLKIDRSFVADIPDDADDMAITAAIVSLAQKLGLDVIAEGVETEAQASFLAECGCNAIQGYLLSKPLPPEDFAAFLRRSTDA